MKKTKASIWVAGLALFSMFFGAGNAVFPVLLGHYAGSNWSYAAVGFLIAGVLLPCFGLIAMLLYNCDPKSFFGTLGKRPGLIAYAFLVFLLGPLGSTPRLITVSYATLEPYLFHLSLPVFSLIACLGISCFVAQQKRVMRLVGYGLTPLLLVCLGIIIVRGIASSPQELLPHHSAMSSFFEGLHIGYALLDVVAALLYASLVLVYLKREKEQSDSSQVIRRTFKASIIAIVLLSISYVGLMLVGTFHLNAMEQVSRPEQVLRAISLHILGRTGGVVACLAVGLACLTTAISQVIVCTRFLQEHILKGKGGLYLPLTATLASTLLVSTLGFSRIGSYLNPTMAIVTPLLILLCAVNVAIKVRRRGLDYSPSSG